jgi:hypothetical protein
MLQSSTKWVPNHSIIMSIPSSPSLNTAASAAVKQRKSPLPLAAQEIACRAYYNHKKQGGVDGRDVEEWLCAEAELMAERFAESE